eukprot:4494407-Amphidinium_carterae.5
MHRTSLYTTIQTLSRVPLDSMIGVRGKKEIVMHFVAGSVQWPASYVGTKTWAITFADRL